LGAGNLPFDLQRLVQQFPVTLYTTSKCGACAEARNLLRQRGVPFTERTVDSEADQRAFAAISRDQAVPAMRIGSQMISGFESVEWSGYLNAAGYPATSRLPASYQNPPPAPLVARTESASRVAARIDNPGDAATDVAGTTNKPPEPSITRRGSAGLGPSSSESQVAPATNTSGIRF
jgi:glutaredoxin